MNRIIIICMMLSVVFLAEAVLAAESIPQDDIFSVILYPVDCGLQFPSQFFRTTVEAEIQYFQSHLRRKLRTHFLNNCCTRN